MDDCRAQCAPSGPSHGRVSPLARLKLEVHKEEQDDASEDSSWVTWSLLLSWEES